MTNSRNVVAPDVTRGDAEQEKQKKHHRFHRPAPVLHRFPARSPYRGMGTLCDQEHFCGATHNPADKKPPLGLAQRRLYAVTLAGMIAPPAIDRQLIGRKLRNGAPLQQPETKRSVIFCRKLFRSLRHPVVSNLDLATSPWSKLSLGRALPVQCRTSP